jgi:hypothetical protein
MNADWRFASLAQWRLVRSVVLRRITGAAARAGRQSPGTAAMCVFISAVLDPGAHFGLA